MTTTFLTNATFSTTGTTRHPARLHVRKPVAPQLLVSTRRVAELHYGVAMGNELLGDKVWSDLAPHLKHATTVNAAIGYVSSTAESVFAPPAGSRLVVDGSDPALRRGLTSPAVLRRWKARGVDIRSVAGLHAKSMVITYADQTRRVVVGSANASKNSANALRELAVILDDSALADSLESLFNGWWAMGQEVDTTWLDRADGVYQAPPRPRQSQARRAALHRQGTSPCGSAHGPRQTST